MNWGLPETKLMNSREKMEGKTPVIVIFKLLIYIIQVQKHLKNQKAFVLKPSSPHQNTLWTKG